MLTLMIVEGIVILLLAVLVAGLLRSHAEILRTLHALGVDDDAPPASVPLGATRRRRAAPTDRITGVTPEGAATSVSLTDSRGAVLLAFLSTGCGSCRTLWDSLHDGTQLSADARLVVVTQGPDRESPGEVARRSSPQVTTVMSTEAWDAFEVPGSPYFTLVDSATGALLGDGSATTWRQVSDLVSRSAADRKISAPTSERLRDTAEELRRAGIGPDDPSLYPEGEGR